MEELPSVVLIEALSRVWSQIQRFHPEVPNVVLLPAPASGKRPSLGHFAALRWSTHEQDGQLLHEVVVTSEFLNRRAEDIVATIIHEAVHSLCFSRKIFDCSPTSQYHNRHFKAAAEELGLRVTQVPHYGFALTTLGGETALFYAEEIRHLSEVLLHRRSSRPTRAPEGDQHQDEEDGKANTRSCKATCACPFIIRVSRKTLRDTVIRCESCGEPFRLS